MNKEFILSNLRDAAQELASTIHDIESDTEYEYGNFAVAMNHLYHHLNTAWNGRNASDAEVKECTEDNFFKWRQFPNSDEIYLEPLPSKLGEISDSEV
jgi:hypothetical protein